MSASQLAPKRAVASPPAAPSARRARWFAVVAGTALLAAVGTFALRRDADERAGAPHSSFVLAIGSLGAPAGEDSSTTSRVLRDLLATDLARVSGITVVSGARLQELHLRLARGDSSRAAIMRTARAAGAQEVLEGELYRRGPETMRLDVRRVELASGAIRRAYTVEGSDLFTLVARLSTQVAAELGQAAPSPQLGIVTTGSLVAWKLYGEGRRALVLNDLHGALRLFEAALAEDSTFAMAAFWAAHVAGGIDAAGQLPLLAKAMRASRHASPRDRLLVATAWAMATNDTGSVSLADSLARGDPLDLESRLLFSDALLNAGQFERAIGELNAIVMLDTADGPTSDQGDDTPCTACRALANLAQAYACIDSVAAGERVLRTWTRLRPRSAQAWGTLGATMAANGRARAAEQAWDVWRSVAPPTSDLRLQRAELALRLGDFAAVDRQLADLARDGGSNWRAEAFWWQVISYRMQGRLDAALRAALQYRAQAGDPSATLPEAQVLLERGRFREAARTFEGQAVTALASLYARLPAGTRDSAPGMQARAVAWPLTLAATAYALAGDTARLVTLVDTVALLGARDAYWRDRVLHHHVRGLLWAARGRPEDAIAEFRRAIVVPTIGYSRSNLELARLLMTAGRPGEAIEVLEPALRGDLQASNYYVTHTELHEAMALALDAAGRPDEAGPHWRWVAKAWNDADAPFRERATRAKQRAGS
jgi:tetratricopeptide (TPR) repeat protein